MCVCVLCVFVRRPPPAAGCVRGRGVTRGFARGGGVGTREQMPIKKPNIPLKICKYVFFLQMRNISVFNIAVPT